MDLIGKTIGNFRIDQLLGEGGMGAVYKGYDLSLQREVAIKFIHPHLARLADFSQRFLREARLMARLDHPGIVKVYMLGKEGDLLFLPMEFIKGGNLRQLLDRLIGENKWLPLDEAIFLVQQLCQVVEYAHQHGVLHRDIKPANLMLKPEPANRFPFRVILTDLGLAKLLEGLGITQDGTSMGTPSYMSPEQASGQRTDQRSDVYSLGVLLYELAVGRLPFQIETITEAARYHLQVPPPAPRSLRPEIPEALERIILKALEKDPNNRYATAAELGAALAGLMSHPTELVDQVHQGGVSLVTKYAESMLTPLRPAPANLRTVLEDEPVAPRGVSVFGNQSVAPGEQTRIQVTQKGKPARVLPLPSGTLTIGRDPENHIMLEDHKASRKHAQVTWDGLEYYVTDLNSTNGTFLQNTKLLPGVAEVWKRDQSLRIGDTWLRIIFPDSKVQSFARSTAGSRNGLSHTGSSAGVVDVSVTPLQLAVEAGGRGTASLSLLNQSPEVDHFSLSLTGIPGDWIASLPSTVQLMPGEQKEVDFRLHIPRTPQSKAGPHPMTLRVTSQRDPSQFAEVKFTLIIAPFSQFRAELQPQRLRAGRTGRLTVSNQGNTQETFNVQFTDPAEELAFQPVHLEVSAPEGGSAIAEYRAQPRQTRWLGGEKSHSFNAHISLPKGEPQTLQANVLSRGLIPTWIPPLIILLCCLFLGLGAKFVPAIVFPTATPTLTPVLTATVTPSSPVIEEWCVYPNDQPPSTFTDCPFQLSVAPGATLIIQWRVSNAEEVIIDPMGNQELSGNRTYVVTENTAFRLKAKNAQIPIEKQIQVSVVSFSPTPVTPTLVMPNTPTPKPTNPVVPTPSITPSPTVTPTVTPTPIRNSSIQVIVYWDQDNNGRFNKDNNGEPKSGDNLLSAVLELYAGSSCSGTVIATPGAFLAYIFSDLEAGTYCVKVIDNSIDNGGSCVLAPRFGQNTKVYQLRENETKEDLDTGFPYVCQ